MRRLLFFVLAWLSIGTAFSQADKVVGVWLTHESNSQVVISKMSDGKYYGQIKWLKEPMENGKAKLDKNNPEPRFRNRPLMNLLLLSGFSYNASGKQWGKRNNLRSKVGKNI